MQYNFEWDPNKAKGNLSEHGISVEQAAGVFLDPLQLTVFDDEHSQTEERWVTLEKRRTRCCWSWSIPLPNRKTLPRYELFLPARPPSTSNANTGKLMKEEYDFSKGERDKFYRPNAKLNLPVYLDADVHDYLSAKAKAKGVEVNDMVNDLLRKDIALIEDMK